MMSPYFDASSFSNKFLKVNFRINKKQFDIVIIGSGGAGLMAALSAIENGAKNIAVISKVIPTNSHTVAAKGGAAAAATIGADEFLQMH